MMVSVFTLISFLLQSGEDKPALLNKGCFFNENKVILPSAGSQEKLTRY